MKQIQLSICTCSENKSNGRRYKNNKSGFKGVFWNTQYSKGEFADLNIISEAE